MKTTFVRPLAAAVAALVLAACKTTTVEGTWRAPEVDSIHFTKILVIAIAPVDSLRKPSEDAMKAEIKSVPAVASYELLPNVADQVDPKKVAEVIKANGIDGIIVMRMIALEDEVTIDEGGFMPVYYQSFSAYYSPGYALSPYYHGGGYGGGYGVGYGGGYGPVAYEYVPPSITTDTLLSIETNIYDAKSGKLIWTGLTRTKNTDERNQTIYEVAAAVRSKLRSQKLIR